MGSVGKVAFVSILGLGAITGVLVYYIFGNAAPAPGTMESIYRQSIPTTGGASQESSQSSSEGANTTSANTTSANTTSANTTSANTTSANTTSANTTSANTTSANSTLSAT